MTDMNHIPIDVDITANAEVLKTLKDMQEHQQKTQIIIEAMQVQLQELDKQDKQLTTITDEIRTINQKLKEYDKKYEHLQNGMDDVWNRVLTLVEIILKVKGYYDD